VTKLPEEVDSESEAVSTGAVGDITIDQIADHGAGARAGAVRTNSDDVGGHDPQMRRECVSLDLFSEDVVFLEVQCHAQIIVDFVFVYNCQVHEGKVHDYLGMTLDLLKDYKVKMKDLSFGFRFHFGFHL
jgi:hypothetical protein